MGNIDRVRKKTGQGTKGKISAFVVAIGGISGAGKTALVEKVAQTLGEAVTFYYDDYPNETPPDIHKWFREGLDANLIKTPQFTEDLRSLKHGKSVRLPSSGKVVESAPFIVVEEPFARTRREVSGLIDLAVIIDVPFEIALARKWLREFPGYANYLKEKGEFSYDSFVSFIYREMFLYLLSRRDEYVILRNQALKNCDLLLDGMKSVDVLTAEVVEAVRKRSCMVIGGTDRQQKVALSADSSIGDVLNSCSDAREIITRHIGMPVDESQLAMAMHMNVRQVAGFLGWDWERIDALIKELNQD